MWYAGAMSKRVVAVVAVIACVAGWLAVERAGAPLRRVLPAALLGEAGGERRDPGAAARPARELIPRSVLFGNAERALVQISPDGKRLAWLAPRDGVMNVWVAPVGGLPRARPVTREAARPIREFHWTYTGRHLVYLQDTGGDENFHILRVDVGDGATVDLTPQRGARAGIVGMSAAQPNALIAAINDRDPAAFDLYRIDLATAERALIVRNTQRLRGFVVDRDLALRFAVRMLPDGTTEILAPESRAVEPAWALFGTIPFEDSDATHVVAFAPGDQAVYMIDSRGRDTAALVSIDVATRRATVLAEDARADAERVMIDPVRGSVQAVSFDYLRRSWTVLDPAIRGDLDRLARLDGGEVHVVSRTLDDAVWVVGTTSDRYPARYYLWERAAQRASFLFAVRPELERHPLVNMTPVEIPARDGLTLVSYLSLPASAQPRGDGGGAPDAPVPMVLLVHGGPWARDHWGYHALHQMLANRGYAVLSVNFRGSTGFGKRFLNAGNLQWSKAMHDDLLDAVAWAVRRGVTTKDGACIMGGSYGGYAALVGVAMTPDAFRCGVDIVGPSNLLTLLASMPPYWAPAIARFHTRMGNPATLEGRAALIAASPITYAANIARPLLIGQGANDPRVKQAESEQIVAAMKAHGLPVTYAVFPDEGHGFARPENGIAFLGVTEAFLAAHLGGGYQPLTRAELAASTMQIREGRDGIPGLDPAGRASSAASQSVIH
jgi:dipeptidyl aminopeptidase/acylaminoacyl peptidase